MQNMSDVAIKSSIQEKDYELSEAEWQSKDSDNSHGSESDRYFKLKEDIPGWTSELTTRNIEKFLFIIASCPLFDMDLRYQNLRIKHPTKFHQDVDKVQCVCPCSVNGKNAQSSW